MATTNTSTSTSKFKLNYRTVRNFNQILVLSAKGKPVSPPLWLAGFNAYVKALETADILQCILTAKSN